MSTAMHEHAARWWRAAPDSSERAAIMAAAARFGWPPSDWRAALVAAAPEAVHG